ncbi:FkbM family methyltransferase [Chryseobacterium oryctis]|uniref:FkbM family methyltransferase n=1 Tax=Chryseobacterium oryctis TaxID=2952618 RepID=A0ABT3HM87_9FLAO|nr:FkbM family methyltransferase [Chryseobacterium oryctis]MCW3160905.1 FkbM family methyltransferase [Chryseobacterium oryctis]
MRSILASFFRFVLSFNFFKKKYFAFHKYIFSSYRLFKGVNKDVVYRNSIKLNLNLEDWIQQQIYFLGDYEKNEIDFLYSSLKKDDVFIDIGGNIGLFSLNASTIIGDKGKVYSFEAFKPNFIQFQNHISINNFQNIHLEHLAVADKKGFIEILYNDDYNNVGMASSYLENYTSKEKVESTSLDEYVSEKQILKIDLIKIDIEGGEYSALKGMSSVLENLRPKVLIEINNIALKSSNHSEEELISLFTEKGYKRTKILSRNENSYNAVFEFDDK